MESQVHYYKDLYYIQFSSNASNTNFNTDYNLLRSSNEGPPDKSEWISGTNL